MKSKIQEPQKCNQKKMNKIQTLLFIILNILPILIFGQEKKIATIIKYDEYVNTSKEILKSNKPLRIESLINEIQSSVYLELDGVKTYGLKPVSLFTSVKNITKINNPDIKKDNIEIINIRINTFDDLKSDVNLKVFSDFKKLKYVYIISDIKCNESDINSIIKNIGNYVVLFKIANNS